jgi:hypothetical protein
MPGFVMPRSDDINLEPESMQWPSRGTTAWGDQSTGIKQQQMITVITAARGPLPWLETDRYSTVHQHPVSRRTVILTATSAQHIPPIMNKSGNGITIATEASPTRHEMVGGVV